MDKISVIVPIYNIEVVEKCVDSIITQTYKNLEIILVDDGSSDHCGAILMDVRMPEMDGLETANGSARWTDRMPKRFRSSP